MSALYIHETFLVYKLETFKNCKELKHIMIMINVFCLMWYLINSWKLLSENPQPHPEKIHSPLFTHYSLPPKKFQKVQAPAFLLTLKSFQATPQKGQERTLWTRGGSDEASRIFCDHVNFP